MKFHARFTTLSLACPIGGQVDDLSHDLYHQLRPQAAAVPALPACDVWSGSSSFLQCAAETGFPTV